jgi:hypothetical protein
MVTISDVTIQDGCICSGCLTTKKLKTIQIGHMISFVICVSCLAELSIEIDRELIDS